jgi:hypothetical protein
VVFCFEIRKGHQDAESYRGGQLIRRTSASKGHPTTIINVIIRDQNFSNVWLSVVNILHKNSTGFLIKTRFFIILKSRLI